MFEFFYDYDYFCANGMNALLKAAGGFFTPVFRAITFLGEVGWAFILASLITVLMERSFIAKEQGESELMKAI